MKIKDNDMKFKKFKEETRTTVEQLILLKLFFDDSEWREKLKKQISSKQIGSAEE